MPMTPDHLDQVIAEITHRGQANPHILLIEQHNRIKELEAEIGRLRAAAVGTRVGTEPAAWRLVSPEGTTVLWSERKDAIESERAKYWPHCRVEPLFAISLSRGTSVGAEATSDCYSTGNVFDDQ